MKRFLTLIIILFSVTAYGQYDSTKNLQPVNGYGFLWKNGMFTGSLMVPRDTVQMRVSDSGAVAWKGGYYWGWTGYLWSRLGGSTPVISDSAWSLNLNSNASGKSLGTSNGQDLIMKTNSVEQLRLLSSGGIRIPSATDSAVGVVYRGSKRFIHFFQLAGTATTLGENLFIGNNSGNFTMTGSTGGFGTRNLAIGDSTLFANTTGYRNVNIGTWNGAANTTGFENVSVGANAYQVNTTGRQNTAIGAISLQNNTTGFRNTSVGFSSLQFNITGERNTAIGGRALQNSSTSYGNVAVGFDALTAGTTTGDHNVGVGLDALYYSNGTHNTAIGDSTLWGLYGLGVLHLGYKNTAIGSRAGYHLGDTYPNYASVYDTACTFIGGNASRDSSIPYSTSLQNMTVIGYNARGTASNQVVLGNTDVTSTLLRGAIGFNGSYGTSGQVLQSNGSSSAPTWVAASTGTVTSIATDNGTGITGGTITTTGTLSLDTAYVVLSKYKAGQTYLPLAGAAYTTTTGNGLENTTSTLTTGNLMKLTSTSTAANDFGLLSIASSGANANSSRNATGLKIAMTNTGTSSTSYGADISVTGATTNRPLRVIGGTSGVIFQEQSGGYFGLYSSNVTPGSSNYGVILQSSDTYINGPSTLFLAGAGSVYMSLSSGTLQVRQTITNNSANTYDIGAAATGFRTGYFQRALSKQGADVASTAGAMTLGTDGTSFEITGTNSITLLSNVGWANGSEVTLMFTGAATLVNGTATSGTNITMLLAGATNFVASADDTITLILSEIGGTQAWREKCRSVN